jgi:hypothetical protein
MKMTRQEVEWILANIHNLTPAQLHAASNRLYEHQVAAGVQNAVPMSAFGASPLLIHIDASLVLDLIATEEKEAGKTIPAAPLAKTEIETPHDIAQQPPPREPLAIEGDKDDAKQLPKPQSADSVRTPPIRIGKLLFLAGFAVFALTGTIAKPGSAKVMPPLILAIGLMLAGAVAHFSSPSGH